MESRETSGSSNRLSLDVANLPLTPFGMRHQGSPRKLTSLSTNRFNKLSRRRGRDLQEGSRIAEYQTGNKENIDRLNSSQRRKCWPVGETRAVTLHNVPEDNTSTESSCAPRVENSLLVVSPRLKVDSPHIDKAQSTESAPIEFSGRRDSIYTDIDDGSFVEFCHSKKKKGHCVPFPADDLSRKTPLYYTCESNNDTQYSTSTKTNNALVGFHKYLDKLKRQMNLRDVWEESEIEELRMQDKANMNNLYDETVITCSADVRKLLHKGPAPAAINSTVMDKFPIEDRVPLPCLFSEISTLTVQPEMAISLDSQHQSNQSRRHTAKHQTVVLFESSDEEKSYGIGGGGSDLTNLHGIVRGPPEADNVRVPPRSGDHGEVMSMPVYSQLKVAHPPPSPELAVAVTGECLSLISEDVSIINNTNESHVSTPHKASTEAVPKTTDMDISSRRGDKVPVIHKNRKKEESNSGGVGHVTQAWGQASIKVKADKQTSEGQTNPVYKWIMSSPFKDSSFDSSFLQRKEDSFISESPSEPKFHKNESLKPHAKELNYKHLTDPGVNKQGINSQSLSRNCESPLAKKNMNSDSESSECEFTTKRITMKQRVIVSTSDESGEDKRNGMYVTQRKKKKHTKIITESFEKDYIGASDSEREESLCLRLTKSHNEANGTSEKTTHTIGKVATSIETRVKTFSKTPNQVPQKLKKSCQSSPMRVENTDSDSPVGIENFKNNRTCSNILPPGTKLHHSTSKEPVTTPSLKTENSQYIGDSDGPLDLSLIKKELDNLYTIEWRKNEDAIFKTLPKERKQRRRITKPKKAFTGSSKRRSKSCPRLKLESEEENSFMYKVSETSGDGEDGDTNSSEQEGHESSENIRSDLRNSGDEKTAKMTPKPPDSPEEDSFEEYLKKARVLTQQKKQQQGIKLSYENEDRYESSFINDDSSENESYSLPLVTQKSQNRSPVYPRAPKYKSSVPRIQDRETDEEKHESNMDDRSDPSNGDEMTPKTTLNPEEDSFEEYLKKARVLTQKKWQQKVHYLNEDEDQYESSFIDDDSSDNESYSLPPVNQKPLKIPSGNLETPKHKVTVLKKQGRGTTGTNNDPRTTTTWRDSPTITLTSDSDSDEVYSFTKTSKKVLRPPPSSITPRKKERGKVLPKTEGHCRQLAKKYETGQLSPRLPFLASLSSNVSIIQCHPDALPYIKNFRKKKEELVEKLYKYYNAHVFDGKLPSSMNIKWNVRLTKTAGYCYYQINKSTECQRGSRIELSTKVIDSPERLRDTLIHELCHAAAWIISGYKDGHGPLWKAWAAKARAVFPELPAINRCHSYQIQCKYTYRCTSCSYSIGRHSKSLDTQKKVCGYCLGKFELLVNTKTQRGQDKGTAGTSACDPLKTPKTPGPFALFVKENYGSVKRSIPHLKHGDVMRILSTKFEAMKTSGDKVFPS